LLVCLDSWICRDGLFGGGGGSVYSKVGRQSVLGHAVGVVV